MNHKTEWAKPFMLLIETAMAAAGLRPSQASNFNFMSQGLVTPTEHVASQGRSLKFTNRLPEGVMGIALKWSHDGPLMKEEDQGVAFDLEFLTKGGEYAFCVRRWVWEEVWKTSLYTEGFTDDPPEVVASLLDDWSMQFDSTDCVVTQELAMYIICELARTFRELNEPEFNT